MPFPRSFGDVRSLPNPNSPHQTPASLLLDIHWANLQLVERWDWNRFARLCQFLQYTPWELASLVMMRHELVERYKRTSRLPGGAPKATALILTLVEAQVMANWVHDAIANPFPKMPNGGSPPPSSTTTAPGSGR